MIDINDYHEEKSCIYKDEEYLVRDNGAVFRKSRPNKKLRKNDNEWSFGRLDSTKGDLKIGNQSIHRIVAVAFLLQAGGAREKLAKENAEECFAVCGRRGGLRALHLRKLLKKFDQNF